MFSSLMGTICNSLVMKFVLKIDGIISFIMQTAWFYYANYLAMQLSRAAIRLSVYVFSLSTMWMSKSLCPCSVLKGNEDAG